ncbi:MAG: phosphotransferase [Candidatus Poribacteria bacterium]
MPGACREMGTRERQATLANYLRAVGELATFDVGDRDYGGLLPSTVWLTAPSWGGFLRAQLEASLRGFADRVASDFPRLQATVTRLEAVLDDRFQRDQSGLVHGDYLPQNVLVSEDCSVSAVFDFGSHSMVGDTRLDICTAVGFLELDVSFTAADTSYLREIVAAQQTADEAWVSSVYEAYSAIVLGSAYSSHAGVYRWCVETLEATSGRF